MVKGNRGRTGPRRPDADLGPFRDWLTAQMVERGLVQPNGAPSANALARKMGVSGNATVNRWLRGQYPPSAEGIRKLSSFFGVPPEHIYRLLGQLPPKNGTLDPLAERVALSLGSIAWTEDRANALLGIVGYFRGVDEIKARASAEASEREAERPSGGADEEPTSPRRPTDSSGDDAG
jgi:transcriptional regulator with XRE-family HTH domain